MAHRWSVKVHKDYLKFSAAHFLIFPDGSAEKLHGHNYKVYVELRSGLNAHGMVLDFRELKPLVRAIVDELDECLLLPGEHPVMSVHAQDDGMTRVEYRERYYLVPTDEVRVLPINNTSAENLAAYVCRALLDQLQQSRGELPVEELIVGVEETPGQEGVYHFLSEESTP